MVARTQGDPWVHRRSRCGGSGRDAPDPGAGQAVKELAARFFRAGKTRARAPAAGGEDLEALAEMLFRADNRAGVPGTLHRISAIRGRDRSVIGLTYRVGRSMPGAHSAPPCVGSAALTCQGNYFRFFALMSHGVWRVISVPEPTTVDDYYGDMLESWLP